MTDQEWLGPGGAIASDEPGASGRTGPSDRFGSDNPGAPQAGFESPRVTFGNWRSPGADRDISEPRWQAPAPAPAPPPPPVAPAPPSWVDRIATPPVAVSKQLGDARAADWLGPLWGIAGLLLIPAAGAALGYRQARAAHAVDRLRRT